MRRLLSLPKVARCATPTAHSFRWHVSSPEDVTHSSLRGRHYSGRIIPLSTDDVRSVPRFEHSFLTVLNSRAHIESLGIVPSPADEMDEDACNAAMLSAMGLLCPSLSAFIYDLGVPLALEQLVELFIPSLVFVEDAVRGRASKESVLLLDDFELATVENPGYLFHQSSLAEEARSSHAEMVTLWYQSQNTHIIPTKLREAVDMVNNSAFDRYFDLMLKCLADYGRLSGIFVALDSDGRAYVMPGSTEFFLRRVYPCVRKDSYKSLWHVCLSAGWTGFGKSRLSDVEVIETYFDYIHTIMGDNSPLDFNEVADLPNGGGGEGSVVVRRRQEDYLLPSVNELARYTKPILPSSPSPPANITKSSREGLLEPFAVDPLSPLHKLYTDIVTPQAHRVQTRGLSTLMAFLESERVLLTKYDEKTPYELIALATRLSTPSFVLEVLAGCPAKRAKDPTLGPLPSWCFPLYAGYFVAADDMKGIAEMHVRSAAKTVLGYDTADNDTDSLRNACLDLKKRLFQHYGHLCGMHAHVLLCSFRFMQKHEQLHRALKKSIVAVDDGQVKSSRIKEITGNVLNSLTELEYCINTNLMHIPTVPLAPGRIRPVEEPEDIKLAKAMALYQYWYLDWLASQC